MKAFLIRTALLVARAYLRYAPWPLGKAWLFQEVVQPLFGWRQCDETIVTQAGVRHRITSLADFIQLRLYCFGVWEPNITRFVAGRLRRGDVFVDVGANLGYYALLAAKLVGAPGKVFAIEASPSIYRQLRESISLNDAHNVAARHIAVHREHTTVEVHKAPESNPGKTTIIDSRVGSGGEYRSEGSVEALPLGEIVPLDTLLAARIVKVDVEGAEGLVVQGIRPHLARFSDSTEWLIEIDPAAVDSVTPGGVAQIFADFQAAGYHAYRIRNDYAGDEYVSPAQGVELTRLQLPLTEIADVLFSRGSLLPGGGR